MFTLEPLEGSRGKRMRATVTVWTPHSLTNSVFIYNVLCRWRPFWPHGEPFGFSGDPLAKTNATKRNSSTTHSVLERLWSSLSPHCCYSAAASDGRDPGLKGKRSEVQTKQDSPSEGWPIEGGKVIKNSQAKRTGIARNRMSTREGKEGMVFLIKMCIYMHLSWLG